MQTKLFLASQSSTRHQLLTQAGLPFAVLAQTADEYACDWTLPLEALVCSIAEHKMEQLGDFPQDLEEFWVITADTLCCDSQGVIHGKPDDVADAIAKIKAQSNSWTRVATAVCVAHKRRQGDSIVTVSQECQTVVTQVWFDVPDDAVQQYLATSHALQAAGAMVIDGPGAPFVKEVRGSYTNVLGLPLFELRQMLKKLHFF